MKKYYSYCWIIIVCALKVNETIGQTTIDAEFRPRIEFREGIRKPLADTLKSGFVTLQRTWLNFDYRGKILNARISLQDARIWGNSDNKTNSSKIEIYEAWFEYLIASGFSMQMGRQPLKYDDQRLLGAPVWSSIGFAHDVMVLKYKSSLMQIHAGLAYNNSKDTLLNVVYAYTPKQNYKTMGYLWFAKPIYKGTTLTMISLLEGFEKKGDYNIVYPRFTLGGNLIFLENSSAWGVTLTGYRQLGKDPNKPYGKGMADLDALFLATKISCKMSYKLSSYIGIDYYSGSETDLEGSKTKTFNRLYGAIHAYNGYMEYFAILPTQGLIDYYGGITTKISTKLTAELTGHLFFFDKDFVYNKEKTNKNLGTEADLTLTYTVSKEITIQGGYSRYFNSGTTTKYFKMQNVAIHPQQWAYLMFTIKPQLFKNSPII